MDVREKLVELANDVLRYLPWGEIQKDTAERIADRMMDHGVTVQEWKPISEPPKEKGTYLVCTDNGGVLLGHWYGTAWNAGGGANKHLAYWMEKPQPPKALYPSDQEEAESFAEYLFSQGLTLGDLNGGRDNECADCRICAGLSTSFWRIG